MTEMVQPDNRQDGGSLNFVFWRHIDANVPLVIPELEDADVILLESSPFQNKRLKIVNEGILNLILGNELTRRQRGIMTYDNPGFPLEPEDYDYEAIKSALPAVFQGIDLGIARAFHGTGKALRYLDANPSDHPDIVDSLKLEYEKRDAANAMAGASGFEENLQFTHELLTLRGINLAMRDDVAIDQIRSYRQAFAGQSIAVVYGATHSPIYHPFLSDHTAQRKFLGGQADSTAVQYRFVLDLQASRLARFNKSIPDELLHRTLLKNMLQLHLARQQDEQQDVSTLVQDMDRLKPETLQQSDIAEAIAANVDAGQVAQYVELTEAAFAERTPENVDRLMAFIAELAMA